MPDEVIPDTGVVPEAPVESIADVNAARQAWLAAPPPEGAEADAIAATRAAAAAAPPPPSDAALEAQALDELLGTQPPAGQEGATATAPSAPAPAPAPTGTPDPYAQWGGYQAVENAMAVQQALRTEQGVRTLVAQGLMDLGYDVNQVRAALDGAPPEQQWGTQDQPIVDPTAGLADEDQIDLTAGDLRALIDNITTQAATRAAQTVAQQVQPLTQQIQEADARQQRQVTDSALVAVLGPPPADPQARAAYAARVDAIVSHGQQYFDPAQWSNPQHVQSVIARANAEIVQADEARYQAYLQSKRETMLAQPPNTGGGAAGEEPIPEPKNLAESRRMAAAAGFFD
jgi:hypothetical protein